MSVHPFDFEINPHVYSTPALEKLFSEKARYQRWLDFEAALATTQGELNIIPKAAAEHIAQRAKLVHLDLEKVRIGYSKSRNSLIPLLNGLRDACSPEFGEYVHYGATTQDVIDTSEILEITLTLSHLYPQLRELEACCLSLAIAHRLTPMAARSHGQQALPTSFGLKVAVWLAEIRRHIERCKSIASRINHGQLSGAVGTMAALGDNPLEVARQTMARLGLDYDPVSWHTARDDIAELATTFALLTTTLAKIGNEVYQLQKIEIGELCEPAPAKAASSSTMPHKQNPVISQRIVALARQVRYLSGSVVESMAHEHERDGRCLWAEWLAVPQICLHTGATLAYTLQVISGLVVRPDKMLANLYLQKSMITSEWLLFRLSRKMGKMQALDTLRILSKQALREEKSLKDLVLADPELGKLLAGEDLDVLDKPEKYLGQAETLVNKTASRIRHLRDSDPKEI